jgi:hypothetical protein
MIVGIFLFPLHSIAIIEMPEQANDQTRRSPIISDDGQLTPPGLEKIVFIHYKKGFGKPPWAGGGTKQKEVKCYDFLGKGVKWKEPFVDYVINPKPHDGLEALMILAIQTAANQWDSNTSSDLFGTYSIDYSADWDNDAPDGVNELMFGNYHEDGVIAVTVVWGYFGGPPGQREIVEFDILFDTDFAWGDASVDETVMDLQNIATHEIGHGLGLGDLYDEACGEETMYGYSDYGETKKNDLNTGDIIGLQELYGE